MLSFQEQIIGFKSEVVPKPKLSNPNRHHLRLYKDDIQVAFLSFSFDQYHVWGIEIEVKEEYRRKGIATALYNFLQTSTGKAIKFQRTAFASEAMQLFFRNYLKSGKIHSDDGIFVVFTSESL